MCRLQKNGGIFLIDGVLESGRAEKNLKNFKNSG